MSCDSCFEVHGELCLHGNDYCMKFGCQVNAEKVELEAEQLKDLITTHESHEVTMMGRKKKNPMPPLRIGSYRFKSKKG